MTVDPQWAALFATALGRLAEVFDAPLTAERVDAYTEALGDLRAVALEAGAKTIIRTSKWFPKPVEWREAAEQWEAEEAERRRLAWKNSRPLALPGPEDRLLTHEEKRTKVRAIIEQFRYIVNRKPLENRPHNRDPKNNEQSNVSVGRDTTTP